MASTRLSAGVFLTAFKALPRAERKAVLAEIVQDRTLRRRFLELAVIAERRGEPTRSFRTYLTQRKR
jgi:hypothetical protein